MEKEIIIDREAQNRRNGWIATTIFHLIILLLLLWKFASYPDPPPGQEGILISFGEQYVGDGEEQPQGQEDGEMVAENTEAEAEAASESIAEALAETAPAAPPASTPREVVTTEDPAEVAARKEKESEDRKKRRDERKKAAEAKEKADAEQAKKDAKAAKKKAADDAKKKAATEAKRQAEEEARKFEEAKKKFGSMLGGNGSQGNTGKPGDAGTKDGDPDESNLEGTKSFGQGNEDVGGGLAGRGVIYRPEVDDKSQETGKVRIKVCVNQSGKVISANYTLSGSSTENGDLKQKAIDASKKFKFKEGVLPEQCGHITYRFKVQ